MRAVALFAALCLAGSACAQTTDPAYEPLAQAYEALKARDYDTAIDGFLRAIELAPARASIRKDLGYAYLRIGENERARDQFQEAMRLEPDDTQVALEYAFLCYETKQQAEARRIFDRIRKTGNPIAEQAFHNIDDPLAAGIARWKDAIGNGANDFNAHYELATLAEQRDELELAAEHYEKAWRIHPDRRTVLVDLGRVWKALNRVDEANAALLAAWRGGEPRAAEMARELLPDRYPYVSEFQKALELDPENVDLRRELAYLLLRLEREPEAEQQFSIITKAAPDDLLSATQLGFLLFGRGDVNDAMPLFDRVLSGPDEDLANRVRAVLRRPQVLRQRNPEETAVVVDAKVMAERSMKAGYTKDALKYLEIAHEAEPGDFDVMLRMGWAYNILHQDGEAVRWFDLARHSTDEKIAAEALKAWKNLRSSNEPFQTTVWAYPLFSTRWHDLFSYAQAKAEWRKGPLARLHIRPYLSLRFIGDTRVTIGAVSPQYLSQSSFIVGAGLTTIPWRGITAWGEAGSAMSYVTGHIVPDYRGGVSAARNFGATLTSESSGIFTAINTDGVFVSQFGNDFLLYQQTRLGFSSGAKLLRAQVYWNFNTTVDAQRQGWANFVETGPGIRIHGDFMPPSMYLLLDSMRGWYLIHGAYPVAHFTDIRAGIWYAVTR
ncbi:MAG TPA: tetratricopeptide repeat protein [Bryobacteraceae bacterium]|jgi:tetratricopeptide (TPR) repeat protein